MHRKVAVLLALIQIVILLPACTMHKPAAETIPVLHQNETTLNQQDKIIPEAAQHIHVVENVAIDGRVLRIDAQVTLPNWSALAHIRLGSDVEKLNDLVNDLILSLSPRTQAISNAYQTDWIVKDGGEVEKSLSIQADNIRVYYLDDANDINSSSIEKNENVAWIPHYITEQHPPKLDMTGEEAAKIACSILEQYSCFTYFPWNVVAFDAEAKFSSGAYGMELQAFYNGFPIFDQYSASKNEHIQSCKMDAWMSDDGLFSFQGALLLKEIEKTEIKQTLSLDSAIQKMIEDFPIYAIGSTVHVTGICAAYFLQGSSEDTTCTLIPGWAFECTDSAEKSLYERYYTCFYDLETGMLHLLEY